MALTDLQQIQNLVADSKYVLILCTPQDKGDAVGAAIALKTYLEREHKQADIAASGFVLPKNLHFLPGTEQVRSDLEHLQKFIIKVDVSETPIETLSYDVKDNTLAIYLTPKHGLISKKQLRTAQSTFKYDLIITLNSPDLNSLGDIFFNNTDLFYRTPIINIDHQTSNERYGQVNIVDFTCTSTAEATYKILKQIIPDHIDAAIATALLTGMTVATKSFKSPTITPLTLQLASDLINRGADRERIIQCLYRTRTIATLKLWGQALSHLQSDTKLGVVWTTITRDDFTRAGSAPDDLSGIVEELISNSPEAKVVLLVYEKENGSTKKIGAMITSEKEYDALELAKPFSPTGSKRQALFTVEGMSLQEAENMILERIREVLPRTR